MAGIKNKEAITQYLKFVEHYAQYEKETWNYIRSRSGLQKGIDYLIYAILRFLEKLTTSKIFNLILFNFIYKHYPNGKIRLGISNQNRFYHWVHLMIYDYMTITGGPKSMLGW